MSVIHEFNRFRSVLYIILFIEEFDPGSGLTLAVRITHASRAAALRVASGGRLSNTLESTPE